MVRDSASEEDRRYFAVNSYLPKYCSMRNGAICIGEVCKEMARVSRAKLTAWRWDRIVAKRFEPGGRRMKRNWWKSVIAGVVLCAAMHVRSDDAPTKDYWVKLVCESSDRIVT